MLRGGRANEVHFPAYASGLGDDEGDVGELVGGLRAGLAYHKNSAVRICFDSETVTRRIMLTPTKDRWAMPRLTSPLEKDDGTATSKVWCGGFVGALLSYAGLYEPV